MILLSTKCLAKELVLIFHVLKLFLLVNTLFDDGNFYEGVGRFMESNTVLKAIPSLSFFLVR